MQINSINLTFNLVADSEISKKKKRNLLNLPNFIPLVLYLSRRSKRRCSVKKRVLKNFAKFTGKHLCLVSFLVKLQAGKCIKKETLAQVNFEFCEISKNTSIKHILKTASLSISPENSLNPQKTVYVYILCCFQGL